MINPKLIKKIPGFEITYVGGELVSNLDGNVFLVTGDHFKIGLLQNHLKNESYRHFGSNLPSNENENDEQTISDGISELHPCIKVSFQQYTTNPFSWQSEQPDLSENPPDMRYFKYIGKYRFLHKTIHV